MWQILAAEKQPFNEPQFTTNPPRFHHQKITTNTRFFPTPIKKAPINPQKQVHGRFRFFNALPAKNYRG
jgi:hypothetical protein